MLWFMVLIFLKGIFLVIPVLLSVAFMTLAERKVLASIQRRRGPNVVGVFGMLQPFADALKLILKEPLIPIKANKWLFLIAPVVTFSLSLCGWAFIPFGSTYVFVDLDLSALFVFVLSSLSVYGIVIAGWASNSRYAFLGALRSAAQMISYEVSIGLVILNLALPVGSLSLVRIVEFQIYVWFIIPFFPLFIIFFISALAETSRLPFDLPEAEAELVSGYNVEYSGVGFALFFIGEYASILLMSSLIVLFFLGGWLLPGLNCEGFCGIIVFIGKLMIIFFFFLLVRGSFPRYRYDQLMSLGWKVFLPMSFVYVLWTASFLFLCGGLPKVFF